MELGYKAVQGKLVADCEKIQGCDKASDELKAAAKAWMDARNDAEASKVTAAALIAECEKSECEKAAEILADKAYLTKKSFWIFGGDGGPTTSPSAASTTSSLPATT